jgi:RNA recognition motif-containing protein
MPKKLYVGNLPYSVSEDAVRDLFAPYGEVLSLALPLDRDTGRPRGFAFVELSDIGEAMKALDGFEYEGRALRVNEAEERRDGGGGGGGGGGGRRDSYNDRW